MNKEKFLHDIEMVDSIDFGNDKFVTFFGSARFDDENFFVKEAEKLAYKLAKAGFAIITGGGESVMKAANKGANLAGKRNLGFNIVLPHEQHSNEFIDESFVFSTFALRKYALMVSDFFVIFPGGFGTMDEFFEILTLNQVKFKNNKIYLYNSKFWLPLIEFFRVSLLKNKTIKENDLKLFKISDDIEDIFADIKASL